MSDIHEANCEHDGNSLVASSAPHAAEQFDEILKEVYDTIAPVWPLKDYVAVNPYFGIHQRRFMDARAFLKVFSDCEMLMPLSYYAQQYQRSAFDRSDIVAAISELAEVGLQTDDTIEEIVSHLQSAITQSTSQDQPALESNPDRQIRTIAELATKSTKIHWTEAIRDDISSYCASHYDDGQASWQSPFKHLPLYQAWRTLAAHDRSMESLGMTGFREYVQHMPYTAEAAILYSLNRMNIPVPLWATFLFCQAFSIPGWSAWAKYQDTQTNDSAGNDLAGLLAIRLAYDAILSESLGIRGKWAEFVHDDVASFPMPTSNHAVLRYTLLRASEIGVRKNLLRSLVKKAIPPQKTTRQLAQMVFCIDVRSERMRRQIETVTSEVETFGFAGFFGMPIAYNSIGQSESVAQLPVLLKPQFEVREGLHIGCGSTHTESVPRKEPDVLSRRVDMRSWRRLWQGFQTSAVGCFSFVETTGLFFGFKLLSRMLGWNAPLTSRYDGVSQEQRGNLGPTLKGWTQQGVTFERQVALAAGLLTNLGLTKNFARLVILCGHSAQTDNNPLAASLDCGACGGHSGEPNARLAALLLNQHEIRAALRHCDIDIPDDTHFLGAVHNTTTDSIEIFDSLHATHTNLADVRECKELLALACQATRQERMPTLSSNTPTDLLRRAADWSEVRPEWGLAGNAAFIVAPRSMTKNVNLGARAFLHSYDHSLDPDGQVLELIMTAPMVVGNWINMQYYASTVDNHHFGSGNKTVHNVVGQFGILSGNGGDLMTGLPWQSLHNGEHYQHLPLRLQVVIAAPLTSIERVIEKHALVALLITNGWLHLVAIEDDGRSYRYTAMGTWEAL